MNMHPEGLSEEVNSYPNLNFQGHISKNLPKFNGLCTRKNKSY
jgi:hypothetical protein